jgi:hypothetical protein
MHNIRDLIADDGYAISFQSMRQYRTALLKALDSAVEPPPAPSDEDLLAMRSWSSHGHTFDSDLVDLGRRCYNLGRQHGGAQH